MADSTETDFHKILLETMQSSVRDLAGVVSEYHDASTREAVRMATQLDIHVVACDKRSAETKQSLDTAIDAINASLRRQESGRDPDVSGHRNRGNRLWAKLKDESISIIIMTIFSYVVWAMAHGAPLP